MSASHGYLTSRTTGRQRALRLLLTAWCSVTLPCIAMADEVAPGTPSGNITPGTPCVSVPVVLTRGTTPAEVRAFSVDIELSAALALCTPSPIGSSFAKGGWLAPHASFLGATDLGSKRYRVDGSILGSTPCGSTAGGTLFSVSVAAAVPAPASGTVSVIAASLRDCAGGSLPVTVSGTASTVTIDPSLQAPALTAEQVRFGNGTDGTTKIRLSWNLPAGATEVEIYCAKFGNHPEYDDPAGGTILRRINFQPAAAPTPPGYDVDAGEVYSVARQYGWSAAVTTTARNLLGASNPQDTFARHFNADPAGIWEIDVAALGGSGPYQVRVVCGDAFTQGRHLVQVEGVTFFDNVLTNGGQFVDATQTVAVSDGKLTMWAGYTAPFVPTLSETKVNFIEISSVGGGASGAEPPAVAAFPPPAAYTLLATSGGTTLDHEPVNRDFYYYVAYAKNGTTRSGPSNRTNGTLNYHLGDFFGTAECNGDNDIGIADVTFFGLNYGRALSLGDPLACLDIGPTSTGTVLGRPVTDNSLGFEDLLILAQNFDNVSKTAPAAPRAAADALGLEVATDPADPAAVEARIRMQGAGRLRGVAIRLAWDAGVVEPAGAVAGDWLEGQGGLALSPAPGAVDVALLGARDLGLAGEGIVASVRFRRTGGGDPGLAILGAEARDLDNRRVEIGVTAGTAAPGGAPRLCAVLGATPNPFNPATRIDFVLASRGTAELAVYALDGRRVKTLLSEVRDAGPHQAWWNGTDAAGQRVASGVYYARLTTREGGDALAVVLVK